MTDEVLAHSRHTAPPEGWPRLTGELRNAQVHRTPGGAYLTGFLFHDHTRRWPDGAMVTTSRVGMREGNYFKTGNSLYLVTSWRVA